MEAESAPSKERDDVVRALLRLLFYKAARIYRSVYEEGGVQLAESEQNRIGRDFRLAVEKHFRTTTSVSDYAKYLHVTRRSPRGGGSRPDGPNNPAISSGSDSFWRPSAY